MRVTQDQMRENRRRILAEASRLFREKGFEAVGVAEVMKAAGLTHGGFYGHFASKEDLLAHAIEHAAAEKAGSEGTLPDFLAVYLSSSHRDDAGGGCPMAALAADVRLRSAAARSAMTAGIRSNISNIEAALPDSVTTNRRRDAIGSYAAMIGALILARAVDDPALSNEVLAETRAWMEADV
ncbi:virulence, Disease and Defense [Methylobacterium phyllosphaerae]|uniref:Transcriptional regulator, TetR family n=2 Tax=Methylobacterium TaxID=407 RepID=A0AAE8HPI4_9HYPH|nr:MULTISPECIES: helix-turn-helix domain-containing protein [Methylobacterium]AIQ89370.1 TetR family transcriptional regulator [Methylobacterium oryzae CBMB20]APT30240.1 virulence, Disease and Defense [Methylobacterium phyllosphaerae]SFG53071.1 transcriptional regulator, TetR family [Methylobacterium phyllosphaerae]